MNSDLRVQIEVDAREKAGIRLDRALADELKKKASHLSRAILKEFFSAKKVRLGANAAAASTILNPGLHEITILGWADAQHIEAPRPTAAPEGAFLPVIFEDESLLVLDKAPGVPSAPQSAKETHTAVSSALAHFPELQGVGFGGLEPGLLHRLDNGTSGVLVFAKNQAEFTRLRAHWKHREVKKIYRARVSRNLRESSLKVLLEPTDAAPLELRWLLAHDEKSAKKMIAFPQGIRANSRYRGTPIETKTRIVKRHHENDFEIEIVTGVMHQIRCVLSTLGYPVLGDVIYGGEVSTRIWLHAWRLELPRADGSRLLLEAPLPWELL